MIVKRYFGYIFSEENVTTLSNKLTSVSVNQRRSKYQHSSNSNTSQVLTRFKYSNFCESAEEREMTDLR